MVDPGSTAVVVPARRPAGPGDHMTTAADCSRTSWFTSAAACTGLRSLPIWPASARSPSARACPANSVPEVKDAVRKARGYVSEQDCGAGVHEALLQFLRN